MEAAMKRLAAEAKAQEAAAKEAAAKAKQSKIADALSKSPKAKPSATDTRTSRSSSLTAEERRDLENMADARDDAFFFSRLMGGVVPLDKDPRGRVHRSAAPEGSPASAARPERVAAKQSAQQDDQVRDHLMELVEGAVRFEVLDDGRRLEGRRLDLSPNALRSLRRGELPVDGQVDLHGLSAEDAKAALTDFLRARRARKDRVVLVIHGRGQHSPAGIGVLRGEIAAWLSQDRASQHVAAFATAQEADGGEGALYVLLRP